MVAGRWFTQLARDPRPTVGCAVSERGGVVVAADGKEVQERVWKEVSEKLEKIKPGILAGLQ
jgi:hypothetical protein